MPVQQSDPVLVYWKRPAPQEQQISFAHAGRASPKDEDFYSHEIAGSSFAAFAVFDGHTGKRTAQSCAELLLPRILGSHSPRDPAIVTDAFWSIDQEIGARVLPGVGPTPDGSTATVLVVEKREDSSLACLLSWVGDSTALIVDMRSGKLLGATINHAPGLAREQQSLRRMQAVRQCVDLGNTSVKDALSAVPGARVAGAASLDEEVAIIERAMSRGRSIAAVHDIGAESRRNLYIGPRSASKASSRLPMVVSTELSHTHSQYYDLQMTRSIVDWRGPDLVLPHPEHKAFDVSARQHVRVILASDGLWDVCTHSVATHIARAAETPKAAADALLAHAESIYLGKRGKPHMGDDTTVLCVDLNPSALSFLPAPAGGAGGCAVM